MSVCAPVFRREDARGLFLELVNGGSWGALSHGRMTAGAVIGNHYHKKTEIVLFLLRGRADVSTVQVTSGKRQRFPLSEGEGVRLVTNESHAIRFLADSEFVMLKSLPYSPEDPDTFPLAVDP